MRPALLLTGWLAVLSAWPAAGPIKGQAPPEQRTGKLTLRREQEPGGGWISRGSYTVFENRETGRGRQLSLEVVVLHARSGDPRPDPVFILAGGPGVNAVSRLPGYRGHWMRAERDLVLVSQRGTGGDHRLEISRASGEDDFQADLDPLFDPELCRRARVELSKRADLTQYSTPIAMDDLDEIREALGYERINLWGGSYGTRAALIYLRRHGEHVRSATLMGVAPLMFKNPLYHAWSAQQGLERLFEEIERDPEYRRAFPELRGRFAKVLARLEARPAAVVLRRADNGAPISLSLTRSGFAEGLRTLMYSTRTNRGVPRLILAAYHGDLTAFARAALISNRGLRRQIALGLLLCVTAAEDLARITEAEIERLTRDTFLGAGRVRAQIECGALWPKSTLPEGFGDPVRSAVPTLIISGTHDPVTPPEMGAEVERNFEHGLHLVLPGVHGISHPALSRVMREFLERGSVEDLDLSPLSQVALPRLELPDSL